MFTGIIQAIGAIRAVDSVGGDARLRIGVGDLSLADVSLGDSIAVNGVCLTVVAATGQEFAADVSQETLTLTTLGAAVVGTRVNLEPALTLATPLGGHLVSGHVDGVGTVVGLEPDARSARMRFSLPAPLARFACRRAAGRAWKFAHRHLGSGLGSPWYRLYVRSVLGMTGPAADFIERCAAVYDCAPADAREIAHIGATRRARK